MNIKNSTRNVLQTICVIVRAGERVSNMITYISEWSRSFGNVIVRRTRKTVLVLKKKFIAFGSNRNYLNLEFTGIIRCRIHFLIINRVCYVILHFPICHLWWTHILVIQCTGCYSSVSLHIGIYQKANISNNWTFIHRRTISYQ